MAVIEVPIKVPGVRFRRRRWQWREGHGRPICDVVPVVRFAGERARVDNWKDDRDGSLFICHIFHHCLAVFDT